MKTKNSMLSCLICSSLLTSTLMPATANTPQDSAHAAESKSSAVVDTRIISASNNFGFGLLKELEKSSYDNNLVISPPSVSLALAMTANGAANVTKEAMTKVLGLSDISMDRVNASNQELISGLKDCDPQVVLNIANSLWGEQTVKFKPAFLIQNQKSYDAQISSLDFNNPHTVTKINDWVSKKTNNKITTITNKLDQGSMLVLLNAIYFNGKWSNAFNANSTYPRDFFLLDGSKNNIKMMNRTSDYMYFHGDGIQAIRLPYGNGRFEMCILLPDISTSKQSSSSSINKTDYQSFLEKISQTNWDHWMQQFSNQKVDLILPRFKVEMEQSLKNPLSEMGMSQAFDRNAADFTNMCNLTPEQKVWISDVIHKTFMEVNEKGTEAAAVTAVVMMGATCAVQKVVKPLNMVVDHPFVVTIRDTKTGLILFLGTIVNPKQSS